LVIRMTQVFAGTDLRLMATTLARMRQGLKVVGAVPEFRHGHQRVAALEDRLESAVSPALHEALHARNAPKAQELCEILVAIGRFDAAQRTYVAAHTVRG